MRCLSGKRGQVEQGEPVLAPPQCAWSQGGATSSGGAYLSTVKNRLNCNCRRPKTANQAYKLDSVQRHDAPGPAERMLEIIRVPGASRRACAVRLRVASAIIFAADALRSFLQGHAVRHVRSMSPSSSHNVADGIPAEAPMMRQASHTLPNTAATWQGRRGIAELVSAHRKQDMRTIEAAMHITKMTDTPLQQISPGRARTQDTYPKSA